MKEQNQTVQTRLSRKFALQNSGRALQAMKENTKKAFSSKRQNQKGVNQRGAQKPALEDGTRGIWARAARSVTALTRGYRTAAPSSATRVGFSENVMFCQVHPALKSRSDGWNLPMSTQAPATLDPGTHEPWLGSFVLPRGLSRRTPAFVQRQCCPAQPPGGNEGPV